MKQAKEMDNEQEKGNTRQFDVYRYFDDTDLDELIGITKELNPKRIRGEFKVTIEFYPDDEDSEVEDEN